MINLNPINKKIRQTLAKRSEALKRDTLSKDPLAPISDDLVNTTSRSVWVKMFSPVKIKSEGKVIEGARIFGGEVFEQDGEFPILFGYGQTYGRVSKDPLDTLGDGKPLGNQIPLKRPIPGITNFDCSYEGGISAIRTASVNFIVWSLEDLERLTPNFLSHGRGVLLEWGYGSINTSSTETISDEEMIDGRGYNKINKLVIDNGGLYDGMAAIISNYEYSLRDDGGFDCTLKLVSRGVNVLNEQLDNSDASFKAKSGDDTSVSEVEAWPTLDEFTAVLEEELLSIAVPGTEWFTSVETIALSSKDDTSWDKSKQPPGVFVYQDDATLSFEKRAGPYVTWGWLEDNILSKWVGRFDKDKKVVNQFRSIEPVTDLQTGDFLDENGNPTTDIEKAKFESVKISNSEFLVTPHMDRWILPGQFPASQKKTEEGRSIWKEVLGGATVGAVSGGPLGLVIGAIGTPIAVSLIDFFHTSGDEFRNTVADTINTAGHFEHFRVEGDEGKGYLRNILLSTNLIRESFAEAKTLKEGLQGMFDEINKDVDGFWSFKVVVDPYLNGNVKVVDTKSTVITPENLIKERKDGVKNPDSALYVFDSWGEESIVKKQELTVQLPSSFAVSAMYAGVAEDGTEESAGATDESTYSKLTSADGEDPSQPKVVKPSRIEGRFGSQNPYLLEGAGALPSTDNKYFGPGKGIGFNKIDYVKLFEIIEERVKDNKEGSTQTKKRVAPAQDSVAQVDVSIGNFLESKKNNALYDKDGNLGLDIPNNILHKKVMNNILKGNVNVANNTNISEKDLRSAQDASDLFPVNLTIEIDGIGGIFPGNCFHVNYIQERFKNFCVFQCFGVTHNVSKENWSTELTGVLRVATGLVYENLRDKPQFNPTQTSKDTEPEPTLSLDPPSISPINVNAPSFETAEPATTSTAVNSESDAYQLVLDSPKLTEIQIMASPNSKWTCVVFAYDKFNPEKRAKGEAEVKFQTGYTLDRIRSKKTATDLAKKRAMENLKQKYNFK